MGSCRYSRSGTPSSASAYAAKSRQMSYLTAYVCRFTRCRHFSHADNILGWDETRYGRPPEPGIWHVHHLEDAHHLSIAPLWFGSAEQKAFWKDMGHWLRSIDAARQSPPLEICTAHSR